MGGLVATGCGVVDMKGGIVALELAFELLAGSGRALAQPVQVVLVGDEAVSSPNGRTAVMEAAAGGGPVGRPGPPPPHGRLNAAPPSRAPGGTAALDPRRQCR